MRASQALPEVRCAPAWYGTAPDGGHAKCAQMVEGAAAQPGQAADCANGADDEEQIVKPGQAEGQDGCRAEAAQASGCGAVHATA